MHIDYFFRDMKEIQRLKTDVDYKKDFIKRNLEQNNKLEIEIKSLEAQIELLEMRLKPAKEALDKV